MRSDKMAIYVRGHADGVSERFDMSPTEQRVLCVRRVIFGQMMHTQSEIMGCNDIMII